MHAEHADNTELNELSGQVMRGPGQCDLCRHGGACARLDGCVAARVAGLSAVQQRGVKVHYKDILAGEYFVDLLIDDVVLVELKTVKAPDGAHMPRAIA